MKLEKYFNTISEKNIENPFQTVYYPCSNYDFEIIRTLEDLNVDKFIFCDSGHHIDIRYIENQLGLKGYEIIEVNDIDENDIKSLVSNYDANQEIFKPAIEDFYFSKCNYIKEFVIRINSLKEICLLFITSEAFTMYYSLCKMYKSIPILISLPGGGYNGAGANNILIELEKKNVLPDVIYTSELESINEYELVTVRQMSHNRVIKVFVKKDKFESYKIYFKLINNPNFKF